MPVPPRHHDRHRLTSHRLSLARIASSRDDIDACFLDSPVHQSAALSARLGCDLLLKDESDNPIGCFKGRGAACLLSRLAMREPCAPLVCASAGNFGLAMAHACVRHGVELTVFVSRHANATKVEGIRRLGARVVCEGEDFDAAKAAARDHARSLALHFIEDGVDIAIGEGAGTIAMELLDQAPRLDAVLVPLGNGALLAGMSRWIKAYAPSIEVIGVCSAGAPVMRACWQFGDVTREAAPATVDTIADGIAVRVPVPEAVQDLKHLVDDVLLVDDEQLLAAMRWLHADAGLTVEPAAAVGVAAIAAQRPRFAHRRVATVLTGRNLTPEQIAHWYRLDTAAPALRPHRNDKGTT